MGTWGSYTGVQWSEEGGGQGGRRWSAPGRLYPCSPGTCRPDGAKIPGVLPRAGRGRRAPAWSWISA